MNIQPLKQVKSSSGILAALAIAGTLTVGCTRSFNKSENSYNEQFPNKEIVTDTFSHTTQPEIAYYEKPFSKVSKAMKQGMLNALDTCTKVLNPEFFKGMTVHVTRDFANLDTKNPHSKHLNITSYKHKLHEGIVVTGNDRDIYLQAIGKPTVESAMTTTLHEMGHSFDEYYGCQNKDLQAEYNKLLEKSYKKQLTEDEKNLMKEYKAQNDCSDTPEFKEAILQDLANIDIVAAEKDFPYFIGEFVDENGEIPTIDNIDDFDYQRAEIFAELFAIKMGSNENKQDFLDMFPNTSKLVEEFINKNSK